MCSETVESIYPFQIWLREIKMKYNKYHKAFYLGKN